MIKVFEKRKRGNKVSFFFCGKKILSYIQKDKSRQEIMNFIEKYRYVLSQPIVCEEKTSDYIWQYWAQGEENAPEIVKACFESVDKFANGKKVIRLNDDNVNDYVNIPDFIQEKLNAGIMSKTHFSDYLRTCLLCKYGGTWLDATVYLTDIIPEKISESDFFVFKSISWSECNKIPSEKLLNLLDKSTYLSKFLCLSNWFIHSKKSCNRILCFVKKFLEEYWKNENDLVDYFIYHYFFTFAVLNDKKCAEIFSKMPNISNRNPHLMQNVLLDEFDEELFEELKTLFSIHKLTYKKKKNNVYTFLDKILGIAQTQLCQRERE